MDIETELLRQINDSALSCSERAWLRCELARKLEEAGNYDAAQDALGELWQRIGERPNLEGLDQRTAAEVLLRVGVLFRWIGSTRQIKDAQEKAKDLISESITIFETLQDTEKVAEALTELGSCYWREGALDEARVVLKDALNRLGDKESELRVVALLRSALVERTATRHNDALRIHTENAPLVDASSNHALKGKYHNELGAVLMLIAEWNTVKITEIGLLSNMPPRAFISSRPDIFAIKPASRTIWASYFSPLPNSSKRTNT
jgi:tetratricopeptide (TPR) repeat protein